ncbi:MAG: sarcosine oxidase subunit gamma family protein [Pseudomonadota bacterium]
MIYEVRIGRLPMSALFSLQGASEAIGSWAESVLPAFPTMPNTVTEMDARQLLWLGAETWLLRAPIEQEETLLADLRPTEASEDISIVCVSDALVFWRIEGDEADQIIAIGSPLDVHPRVFPDTAATWTECFGQRVLVQRVRGGFDLAVDRSYAPMFDDYLARITA